MTSKSFLHRLGWLRGDRGQSAVEFALILPMLLLIVLGTMDLGRAVWTYNLLAEATREGARFAIVHGSMSGSPVGPDPNNAAVTDVVRSFAIGLDPAVLVVDSSWLDGSNERGSRVRVETSFDFRLITLMPLGDFVVPLSSTSEMVIAH